MRQVQDVALSFVCLGVCECVSEWCVWWGVCFGGGCGCGCGWVPVEVVVDVVMVVVVCLRVWGGSFERVLVVCAWFESVSDVM